MVKIMLGDMTAIIADGVRDIEREIVASLLCRIPHQVLVLLLGKMLVKVHV